MRPHIRGKDRSQLQPQFKRREASSSVVADISAKIAEALGHLDVQLLAAERAFEMCSLTPASRETGSPVKGRAKVSTPRMSRFLGARRIHPSSPGPAMPRSVEEVSYEQSKANNATG
jgi:hypothetical protein